MSDPTYDKEIIDKNPTWKVAFILSEIYNDFAPVGWSNYISTAETLAKHTTPDPKSGELTNAAPANAPVVSEALTSLDNHVSASANYSGYVNGITRMELIQWRAALTATLSGAETKPVAVKALEWTDNIATTPFGSYTTCSDADDLWHFTFHCYPYGEEDENGWGREDFAKAAAQADYERRIRSALIDAAPIPAAGTHSDPICQKCASNSEGGVPVECTCGDYATPIPAAAAQMTDEMVDQVTKELVAHGEFSNTPDDNEPNARLAAREVVGIVLSLSVTDTARPLNSGDVERKVPEGQTPLDAKLHHRYLDVINEGIAARDSGAGSPYHGHSLEHCLHAVGWVQRDLRLALDAAKSALSSAQHVL